MTYMHTPAEIAAALRLLADDLDAVPDGRLPDLSVSIDVQVPANAAAEVERVAAVDLLAFAALGVEAERTRMDTGRWFYLTPFSRCYRADGLHVSVYATDVSAPGCDAWVGNQLCDLDRGHFDAHSSRPQSGRWVA
jgi:hypothetical protein